MNAMAARESGQSFSVSARLANGPAPATASRYFRPNTLFV
jgi:hypothetical protein